MSLAAATLAIIVPVRDEAAGIIGVLDALAPLRAAGHPVIVVDGGSRDGTVALCRGRCDRLLVGATGRAAQMNAGAAVAACELLLFLHADTTLPDGAIELIRQGLTGAHLPGKARVWGRFDVRIAGRSRWLPMVAAMMNARSRLTGIATGDQAIFVRRDAFVAVGGFPAQPLMEDIELSRRLKRLSPPLCLRPRVTTSGRRWDRHGVWRTIVLMWRLRLLYWLGRPAESLARAWA